MDEADKPIIWTCRKCGTTIEGNNWGSIEAAIQYHRMQCKGHPPRGKPDSTPNVKV